MKTDHCALPDDVVVCHMAPVPRKGMLCHLNGRRDPLQPAQIEIACPQRYARQRAIAWQSKRCWHNAPVVTDPILQLGTAYLIIVCHVSPCCLRSQKQMFQQVCLSNCSGIHKGTAWARCVCCSSLAFTAMSRSHCWTLVDSQAKASALFAGAASGAAGAATVASATWDLSRFNNACACAPPSCCLRFVVRGRALCPTA